jgi:hypothetical protein
MGDIFDQAAASGSGTGSPPPAQGGDVFDRAASMSTHAASKVPYPANRWRDVFDQAEEWLGEKYDQALGAAQTANEALNVPGEIAAQTVANSIKNPVPGFGTGLQAHPGNPNTKSARFAEGLAAGVVDPRNIPFTMLGSPEVGPAVRAGAGAFLAGTQGLAAGQNIKRGEYGSALVNTGLAALGGYGALSEGAGLLNREAAGAAKGATRNVELPSVAEAGPRIEAEPQPEPPQGGPSTSEHPGLFPNSSEVPAQPAPQGELKPAPKVFMVPTDQIQVDPNRFQFRIMPGKASVEGAQEFNPDLGGTIHVWQDPEDGATYVVNGHHRLYLAKRTGTPEVQAQFINAPDAQTARATGALINIAEGTASPVDAAKFFRDTGATPEQLAQTGLSLSGAVANKGLALSKLTPPIFDQVVRGEMTEGRGAAIGSAVGDPLQQKALVDLLAQEEKRGKRMNDQQVSELGRFVTSAGETTESQNTLFGMEEIRQSNAIPKAKLSSYILDRLAKQRLFGTVAKRATDLAQAGNIIDVENSARMAQEASQVRELYNKLSTSAGPVSDALNDGAESLAKGAPREGVQEATFNRVLGSIKPRLAQMRAAEPELQPAFSLGSAAPSDLDLTRGLSGLAHATQPQTSEIGEALSAHPQVTPSVLQSIRGKMSDTWDALKTVYNKKPEAGGINGAVDRFGGLINKSRFAAYKFRSAIRATVPNPLDREGITNWIQAGGDSDLLKYRLENAPDAYKPGYAAALRLSDEQKTVARNVMNYFDEKLDEGRKAGMLQEGINNYVNQAWAKAPKDTKALLSTMNNSKLSTRFKGAMPRVFGSYSEGERLGWVPQTKDIADLVPTYDQSFTRSLASRQLVRWLASGVASDGKPLAVKLGGRSTIPETGAPESVESTMFGNQVKRAEPEPLPMLANPDIRGEAARGYVSLDHPALKDWSFAGTSPDGRPVLVKADLALHPEIAEKLKNILSRSWFQTSDTLPAKLGRGYMKLSSAVKGSMFFLSPTFHAINEGGLAEANRVNFWHPAHVSIDDPMTSALLDHGMTLGTETAREGLATTGEFHTKIPVLGPLQDRFQSWLFGPDGYISRLKDTTGKALVQRNTKLYGQELTPDEILKLSATQTNNAYGGLNLDSMFRNRTMQDVLRMTTLAPDFLEGRLRYNLGALGKYGGATRQTLAFDFAQRYAMARVLNQVINGKPYWDKPFSVVYHDKEYDMRSNIGDDLRLIQSLTDLSSGGRPTWISYRENPVLRAGAESFLTHRDPWGRPESTLQGILKGAESAIPISLQGLAGIGKDPSLAESVGTASGLHDYQYRSPAASILHQAAMETVPPQAFTRKSDMGKAVQAASDGNRQAVRQMVQSGQLSQEQARRAMMEGRESPIVRDAKRVPVDQLARAYRAADQAERKVLQPILLHRAALSYKNLPADDARKLKAAVEAAIRSGVRSQVGITLRALAGVQ